MTEKRKHTRYPCEIKAKIRYYEGDPDNMDTGSMKPETGKGHILDISNSGLFMVTNMKVAIGMPLVSEFKHRGKKYSLEGEIIRTGLLERNPSELARRFSTYASKGESYIAVEFNSLADFSEKDFQ